MIKKWVFITHITICNVKDFPQDISNNYISLFLNTLIFITGTYKLISDMTC